MPLGDIFDQAVLTDLITKSTMMDNTLPGQSATTGLAARIAPLRNVTNNAVKLRVVEDTSLGMGQFRAPEASYPLAHRNLQAREQFIELVQLAEKIRVNEIMNMRSQDPRIQEDAIRSFLTDGQWLLNRNALLTNWMRWQALENGSLTVRYPDGGEIVVDYGYDPSHIVTASTLWSDTANASIIDDIEAWKQLIVDDAGMTNMTMHMSTKTWQYFYKNDEIKSFMSPLGRSLLIPNDSDVQTLIGMRLSDIVLYDEVYRDANGQVHRFFPENKVLITAGGQDYSVGGLRIAETLNGLVPVSAGRDRVQFAIGPQTEMYIDVESHTEMLRVASARMVRINMPEAIIVATVW